jgi:hypothetical protein
MLQWSLITNTAGRQLGLELALALGVREPGDPLGGSREGDPLAGEAGADREGDRQVGLAGSGRPEQFSQLGVERRRATVLQLR